MFFNNLEDGKQELSKDIITDCLDKCMIIENMSDSEYLKLFEDIFNNTYLGNSENIMQKIK